MISRGDIFEFSGSGTVRARMVVQRARRSGSTGKFHLLPEASARFRQKFFVETFFDSKIEIGKFGS